MNARCYQALADKRPASVQVTIASRCSFPSDAPTRLLLVPGCAMLNLVEVGREGASGWSAPPNTPAGALRLPMGASPSLSAPAHPLAANRLTSQPTPATRRLSPAYSKVTGEAQRLDARVCVEVLSLPSHVAPISLARRQIAIVCPCRFTSVHLLEALMSILLAKEASRFPSSKQRRLCFDCWTIATVLASRYPRRLLSYPVLTPNVRYKPHTDNAQHLSRCHGFMVAPFAH